ncbi:hypothetical protein Dimus_035707 [Dionaea muscipula]
MKPRVLTLGFGFVGVRQIVARFSWIRVGVGVRWSSCSLLLFVLERGDKGGETPDKGMKQRGEEERASGRCCCLLYQWIQRREESWNERGELEGDRWSREKRKAM